MDAKTPFRVLVWECFPGPSAAAEYLEVSRRTVERWMQNDKAPSWARRLSLIRSGDLGQVCEGWDGWKIGRDFLLPPGMSERAAVARGDVAGIYVLRQLLSEQRRRLDALEAKPKPPAAVLRLVDFQAR